MSTILLIVWPVVVLWFYHRFSVNRQIRDVYTTFKGQGEVNLKCASTLKEVSNVGHALSAELEGLRVVLMTKADVTETLILREMICGLRTRFDTLFNQLDNIEDTDDSITSGTTQTDR